MNSWKFFNRILKPVLLFTFLLLSSFQHIRRDPTGLPTFPDDLTTNPSGLNFNFSIILRIPLSGTYTAFVTQPDQTIISGGQFGTTNPFINVPISNPAQLGTYRLTIFVNDPPIQNGVDTILVLATSTVTEVATAFFVTINDSATMGQEFSFDFTYWPLVITGK